MISFRKEILFNVIDDIQTLLKSHNDEFGLFEINHNWFKYAELEKSGNYVICTARLDDRLIGYSGFFVADHIHNPAIKIATNDALFLKKGHRENIRGLIRFSEKEIANLHVDIVTWSVRAHRDYGSILEKMGYAPLETVFHKFLRK